MWVLEHTKIEVIVMKSKFDKKLSKNIKVSFFQVITFFIVACGFTSATGCISTDEPTKSIDRAVTILDSAINKLEGQSIGWQNVLQETRDELLDEGQSTLSNEVSSVLSRAISDVGIEARCYTDFLRDRVKEDLIRLRATLTKEELNLNPVFCDPNPNVVDYELVQENRLKSLEISGYNLDVSNIEVLLVDNQNQETDVTFALADPTRYLLTLDLGSGGVPLSETSHQLIFKLPGGETRSVSITHPRPPSCERVSESFRPSPTTLSAGEMTHCCNGRDKDFDGNGPRVKAWVELLISDKQNSQSFVAQGRYLNVILWMQAGESKPDWTVFTGQHVETIFTAPSGFEIINVSPNFSPVNGSESHQWYIDNDHSVDLVDGDGPIERYHFYGDRSGNDNGYTRMTVNFNNLMIDLIQTENCSP